MQQVHRNGWNITFGWELDDKGADSVPKVVLHDARKCVCGEVHDAESQVRL